MARFYFPLLFWVPSSSEDVEVTPFYLHPRRWDVSIFDLYSLVAERHPLRMTAEIMQIFLPKVNLEVSVDASNHAEATQRLDTLRAMLYIQGLRPTIAPFATSHSLNDYAGINSRSSGYPVDKLPVGMRVGITTKDSKIEGWPTELTFSILRGESQGFLNTLEAGAFVEAASAAATWQEIESQHTKAATLRAALAKAPLMLDYASSILHIWQALECVFGKGPELSFRMSLSLAQLCEPLASREETYLEGKRSYKDRREITHGKANLVEDEQWMRAWTLLVLTVRSILHRKAVPSEDDLFSELLSR